MLMTKNMDPRKNCRKLTLIHCLRLLRNSKFSLVTNTLRTVVLFNDPTLNTHKPLRVNANEGTSSPWMRMNPFKKK